MATGSHDSWAFFTAPCRYGVVSMLAGQTGVLAIELADDRQQAAFSFSDGTDFQIRQGNAVETEWFALLLRHIEDPMTSFDAPLVSAVTEFQRSVHRELRQLRPGETVSYSELATRLGRSQAARAVAGACSRNRHALVVPCHRAVGQAGVLTGYRWGLARKRAILLHEFRRAGQEIPRILRDSAEAIGSNAETSCRTTAFDAPHVKGTVQPRLI